MNSNTMEIIVLRQIKLYESLQWINKATKKERTEEMRRKNINWKRTRRNKGADVHNTGIKNDVNNCICIFYAVFFCCCCWNLSCEYIALKFQKKENYSTGIINKGIIVSKLMFVFIFFLLSLFLSHTNNAI